MVKELRDGKTVVTDRHVMKSLGWSSFGLIEQITGGDSPLQNQGISATGQ